MAALGLVAGLSVVVLPLASAQQVPAPPRVTEAPDRRVAVSIPAQPLLGALRAFGLQTQSQVLFDEALLTGRRADAVHGAFTPREALERLLSRTGIVIATARTGSFTLKAALVEVGAYRAAPHLPAAAFS